MLSLITALLLAGPGAEPAAQPLGAKIQRTMTLLATSTPEHRNRVRVLFYGQSVTAGVWWKDVADWLGKTYPHADLEIENRAIGGFSAPALIHTAEADLYPFYPDLLIFHVYGGHLTGELEELIARVRRRTTAEIIIRTPHYRWPKELARDGSPDDPGARRLAGEDEQQSAKIREIAARFGCELADVRRQWREHMERNDLRPKDLLRDSVHLSTEGNHLLASLVIPHLAYLPGADRAAWQGMVRDCPIDGSAVKRLPDGSIELAFEGNRVDAIAAPGGGRARVLVDGRSPAEFPEACCFTRPSLSPGVWWPAITRVEHQQPLVAEKWTLRVRRADPAGREIAFEVIGSKTGPDGQGSSTKRFVSNSGRVVIEPARWTVAGALKYRKLTMPADFQVTWEARPMFVEECAGAPSAEPGRESTTTLIQGIANARHTLRLVPCGKGPLPVKALRVYRPPLE